MDGVKPESGEEVKKQEEGGESKEEGKSKIEQGVVGEVKGKEEMVRVLVKKRPGERAGDIEVVIGRRADKGGVMAKITEEIREEKGEHQQKREVNFLVLDKML